MRARPQPPTRYTPPSPFNPLREPRTNTPPRLASLRPCNNFLLPPAPVQSSTALPQPPPLINCPPPRPYMPVEGGEINRDAKRSWRHNLVNSPTGERQQRWRTLKL